MKFTKQFVVQATLVFLFIEIYLFALYRKSFNQMDKWLLAFSIMGQLALMIGMKTNKLFLCGIGHFSFSFMIIAIPLLSKNKVLLALSLIASVVALITRWVNGSCLLRDIDKDVIKYPFRANWDLLFSASAIVSALRLYSRSGK